MAWRVGANLYDKYAISSTQDFAREAEWGGTPYRYGLVDKLSKYRRLFSLYELRSVHGC